VNSSPPAERRAVQAAAGGELPLGFGGQRLAGPRGVGGSVLERDMHHRLAVAAFDAARRTFRVAPVRVGQIGPAAVDVVHVHATGGHEERRRTGREQGGIGAGIVGRIERALGDGAVAGGVDEGGELGVGDRVFVHPEAADRHPMDRRFLWVRLLGAHAERAARNPAHAARPVRGDAECVSAFGHRQPFRRSRNTCEAT